MHKVAPISGHVIRIQIRYRYWIKLEMSNKTFRDEIKNATKTFKVVSITGRVKYSFKPFYEVIFIC